MLISRIVPSFCLLSLLLLSGCTPPPTPPSTGTFPPEEKTQPVVEPTPVAASAGARILAPVGHVPDWLKEDLAKKLGKDVEIDTYTSDTEALDKLHAKEPVYDVALVSDRVVAPLIKEQKLAPLPATQPELKADPVFLHHYFDFANHYSFPYAFSLAGVACRPGDVKPVPLKWVDVFSEANLKKAVLPDDAELVAKLSGKANTKAAPSAPTGDAPPENAAKVKPAATTTATNSPAPVEIKLQVPPIEIDSMAVLKKKFSGDKAWRFILPEEGSAIYLYHAVVPATEPADGPAAMLLAELFNPDNLAKMDAENDLGVTLKAALKQVPVTAAQDVQIYPPSKTMDKCYFIRH